MGIKDWLFGRPKDKNAEAIVTLKNQIRRKDLEAKNFLRQSEEQKALARKLLEQKNKSGARQALMRSRVYMQKYNQSQNQLMNLQQAVDSIMTAQSTSETVKAMEIGADAIETALGEVSEEDAMKVVDRLQMNQDRLSLMNEAISDTSLLEADLLDDGDLSVDDEIAQWEAELSVANQSGLPTVPTETTTTTETKESEDLSDLESELQKLRKEAEGN